MWDLAEGIIAAISAGFGVFVAGVSFLIAFTGKARKFVRERNWNKVMEILPGLIIEAEKFQGYSGAEKKEFVKSRLAVYTMKNKIKFDENRFDKKIDEIVRLTKEVNKREKDKINSAVKNMRPLI